MASNFYYRTSNVKESDIYYSDKDTAKDKIRNNAWVKVTAKTGGGKLPDAGENVKETYDPKGTGRPKVTLGDVEISLQGEQGSLRRCKVTYTCYDKQTFNELFESFMLLKNVVSIEYGYAGPSRESQRGGPYDFEIFKPSYKLTKENYFECTFEGMGEGMTFDHIDINGKKNFPTHEFITNYKGTNEKAEVANLFDFCAWAVQDGVGKTNSTGFNPKNGAGKSGLEGGGPKSGICTHIAPDEYSPPSKMESSWWTADRVQYVSVAFIVQIINKYILSNNKKKYKLVWKKGGYSDIKVKWSKGKIWSPSPFLCLFPYQKGTAENSYHKKKTGKSRYYISCDSFDNVGSFALNDGDPGGILISMDGLRAIQTAFDNKPKDEDEDTETSKQEKGKVRLVPFFKKLFGIIRENSGGAWDFALEHKDIDGTGTKEDPNIYIVNRRSPKGESVTPLMIRPTKGENGVREFSFGGEIPKEMAAAAFSGQGDDVTEETKVHNEGVEDVDNEADKGSLQERSKKARGRLNTDDYSADASSAAQGIIREIVAAETLQKNATEYQKLRSWPLKLSLVLDGIEGFRFGDCIGSDYLPDAYDPNKGGIKIHFTVTEYTHKISGNDWSTEVGTLARIVP